MVKIAFNSALAQKALEKEAAASDKVRNLAVLFSLAKRVPVCDCLPL